jgi:hypothetical protein
MLIYIIEMFVYSKNCTYISDKESRIYNSRQINLTLDLIFNELYLRTPINFR